jgi:predicted ArsR family transcriptional regulator
VTADDPWIGVTVLADPSRRALYEYVRLARHPVSRDEAGDATGMSRGLAAFHLDKLVDAGLLLASYEAPADRPRRRGRSAKVYQPTGDGIAVSIPERRYQLIAEILAAAVDDDPTQADRAAFRHADQQGRTLGATFAERGVDLISALAGLGFEPDHGTDPVLLDNCPFHALATRYTSLICGLNHAFLSGLLDGLHVSDREAVLNPRPGRCCVELADREDTAA